MLTIQTNSPHPVSRVVFSPDGSRIAIAQGHACVTLCDRATGQVVAAMPVPRAGDVTSVAFCDGGAKLAVGTQKRLYLFETATGSLLAQGVGAMFAPRRVGVLGEGLLALTRNGLWEVRLPREAGESMLFHHRPWTSRGAPVALSPCGRWAVAVYGRIAPSLTQLDSRRVVATIVHPYRNVGATYPAVTFVANDSRFALCDGNDVTVYDTPADEPDDEYEIPPVRRTGPEVAPKPRVLLKPVFRLGPPDDYKPTPPARLQFVDEDARPNLRWQPPVAFTPDGRGLLVRRPRNRVQLWDVASERCTAEWSWRLEVTSLAVAPDGLTAVAGGRFGRAVVWDME